jgi:hypothetical protein
MKLKQTTEWIVIAGLIVYLAFFPPFAFLRELLATPIGKAIALVGIVYVSQNMSRPVASLLLLAYARCATTTVGMEGMENQTCTCPSGYVYDEASKKCRSATGQLKAPEFCPCPSGYFWDAVAGECKASSPETPTVVPVATSTNAPAVSTGPVTSTAPMTTPSATQDAVANMAAPPAMMGGVQPSGQTESFSPY